MDAYKHIDEAIGEYLRKSGVSQKDFADMLGTNTNSLRWKRRGETDWKFSEVLKVAEIIGVELEELTSGIPS